MSDSNHFCDRRTFLRKASAFTIAAGLAQPSGAQPANPNISPTIPTRDTLLKFKPDGTRRPFAGNTVICHLLAQSALRDALVALHEDLAQASFRPRLGLTPPDSYHMTIFPGANDQDRKLTGWPEYVPPDAKIEICNQMVGEKMASARLNCELPLRVQLDAAFTLTYPFACTMRMLPADDAERLKLKQIRDQLSELYGFRLRNHDSYQFHITLSYQLTPFTSEEGTAYRDLLKQHVPSIMNAAQVVEFGNPEYCTFPDMYRFDPQKLLACSLATN